VPAEPRLAFLRERGDAFADVVGTVQHAPDRRPGVLIQAVKGILRTETRGVERI